MMSRPRSLVQTPIQEAMDATARTALSIAYDNGRDDELRELRLLLTQRNQEIADLRDRERMLEQIVVTNERARSEACWEALCQAGIRMGGFDTRHLIDLSLIHI